MSRLFTLAMVAVVPLLGCSPAAPPATTAKPLAETPPPVQESVSYVGNDKNVHGFLCRPAGDGPSPAALLIHDRMGLTDGIKDQTFRLAREGYVALAVDLYRSQTAQTAQDAERLQRELSKERALGDLKAAVDYLSERGDVRAANVGVVGLGMGGVYALEAAVHDPRLRALAMCYSPPPTDAKRLKSLKASVFYLFAGKDKSVSQDALSKFIRAMQEAGKRLYPIRGYGDCSPGFLDPTYWPLDGKPPDDDFEDAWSLIARYLDKELM